MSASGCGGGPWRGPGGRERGSPIALAADEPVLEAVGDRPLAEALRLGMGRHLADGFLGVETVERSTVDELAGTFVRGLHRRAVERLALGLDDDPHRQAVLARELEVALVVSGHGHDRPRAVAHEDEVSHPDRNALAAEGVRGVAAGEDTLLLDLPGLARAAVLAPEPLDGLAGRGFLRRARDERVDAGVLGGHDHERRAVDRVDARGEDAEGLVRALDREVDLRPGRAPDPVPDRKSV